MKYDDDEADSLILCWSAWTFIGGSSTTGKHNCGDDDDADYDNRDDDEGETTTSTEPHEGTTASIKKAFDLVAMMTKEMKLDSNGV